MYIRMTDGRDAGQVIDMVEDVARAMLANGQALAVDFSEPDPLGVRELGVREPALAEEVRQPEVLLEPLVQPVAPHSGHGKPPSGRFTRRRT
jgi:hypothetical protein